MLLFINSLEDVVVFHKRTNSWGFLCKIMMKMVQETVSYWKLTILPKIYIFTATYWIYQCHEWIEGLGNQNQGLIYKAMRTMIICDYIFLLFFFFLGCTCFSSQVNNSNFLAYNFCEHFKLNAVSLINKKLSLSAFLYFRHILTIKSVKHLLKHFVKLTHHWCQ